mgnify:CR=1 FL=1
MHRSGTLLFIALALSACGGDTTQDKDLAIEAGERMYREGMLPSGEPMMALVGGDVPIVGTQFSCESCHGRSGMGVSEGAYVVPPVAAPLLFEPSPQPARPAYTAESLGRVLRDGVTSGGRELMVELMPRYELSDEDVTTLTAYLQSLSAGSPPGIDDKVIRVATVVAGDASETRRDAVFAVLERFAGDINTETRNDSARWDRGFTPESKLPTVFREWVIEEWRLDGPPDTWDAQLESYYAETPVFAMLSGVGTGTWEPVGEFCERQKLMCLYPSTDLPHQSGDDFYTVYFSRGLLLEADLIASHLAEKPVDVIAQTWCDDELAPAAKALKDSAQLSASTILDFRFDCDDAPPFADIAAAVGETGAAVLWLGDEQLEQAELPAARNYVSSTLLEGSSPDALADASASVFAAHPFRLPGSLDSAMRRFGAWAQSRDVEIVDARAQAEAFYACLTFKNVVKHMGRYFIREYALDMIDHAESMAAYMPLYPRPTFGPGQRYISKGGYIVPVVDGALAADEAEWILP